MWLFEQTWRHYTSEKIAFYQASFTGSAEEPDILRFGRIGRTGQTCLKTFAAADEAERAAERLMSEKRKKGYVEVSTEEATLIRPRKRTPQRASRQLSLAFDSAEG